MVKESSPLDEIVGSNLGLVHSCANRFRGRGIEYDDLYQAGCLGLVKAAKNFDSSLGFAFSTYAVPVILGEIKRLFRDGGSVKIGRALKEKARLDFAENNGHCISRKCKTERAVKVFCSFDKTETACLI